MNNFTYQEINIILLRKKGLSYQQIAKELFIEYSTVKTHFNHIAIKAKVKGKKALREFILQFTPPHKLKKIIQNINKFIFVGKKSAINQP